MHDENTMNPTSALSEDDLLIWVEARSEQLYAQARMLVDDYWRQLKSRYEKYGKTESGRIGVRIRRRESSYSFSIEWYRMATLRQNGQNKPIAQYLKKGLGYRYPLQRILKGEPDWEAKLVEELETEFVDIRKQVECLGKIRDAVQNYRKATQTRIE
ncbi:MAG: hypothetical protein BVN35_20080 [Proteobacteria bacterium ST_bin11]|nr:MAG: hypothetical protein BVN35_20080 [Proteobacteria bacterium ST_bin11]